MKKTILIIILTIILFAVCTFAPGWKNIYSNKEAGLKIYIDTSSIRVANGYTYYKALFRYKNSHKSQPVYIKTDCEKATSRRLDLSMYRVETTPSGDFPIKDEILKPINKDGYDYIVYKKVCKK